MFRFFKRRRSHNRIRPLRRSFRPLGEQLESRDLLSTETWSGGDSNDSNWTSNDNWAGVLGAGAGDDLVFPAGAARLTNSNDFGVNTSFSSLAFNGNGYSITGSQIILTGGITNNPTGTGNPPRFAPNILLTEDQTFNSLNSHVRLDGVVNLNGNLLTLTGAGDHRFQSQIVGRGDVIDKRGSGTARFFGNSGTNAAGIVVNAGTAVIEAGAVHDNSLLVQGGTLNVHGTAGDVVINSGTLRGTGTVGDIRVSDAGSTIAPGDTGSTTGTLTSTNNIILNENAPTLAIDLNGTVAETEYDRLIATGGNILLDDSNLSISLGFTPALGQQFTIIQATGQNRSVSGRFAQGTSIVVDGQEFSIIYNTKSVVLHALPPRRTWDGGGADNNWSTAANWNPDFVPLDGVDLVFPGDAPADSLTNTNDISGLSVKSLEFTGNGYVISGNQITLTGGITNNSSGAGSAPVFQPNILLLGGAGAHTFTSTSSYELAGVVNLNSRGLTIAGAGDHAISQITNFGVIALINKTGPGRLILDGDGSATRLRLDLGNVVARGPLEDVSLEGGTLEGDGPVTTITGLAAGGTISPGEDLAGGVLAANQGVSLLPVHSLVIDLNGTTAGTLYDQLTAGGDISLGGASLDIRLGFTPTPGQTFTIVQTSGSGNDVIGQFAEGTKVVVEGQIFVIAYNTNSVVLTAQGRLTWDGGGANNNWSTAANWNPDIAPVDGMDLVFPTGVPADSVSNVNNISGLDLRSITINAGGYNITGNPITLTDGIVHPSGIGPSEISLSITLMQSQTLDGGSSAFRFGSSGTINLNGRTLTLNHSGNGGAFLLDGTISGTGSVTKTGSGTVQLKSNTYSGVTNINAGTIEALADTSFGATTGGNNDTVVASGAFLKIAGITSAEPISLNAGSSLALTGSVSSVLTGVIFGDPNVTIDVPLGGELNLNGGFNSGNVTTKVGAGTLTLSGNNLNVSFVVTSGKLLVPGILSGGNNDVGVLAGAILAGTGTIARTTTVFGRLAPGTSTGALSTGGLTFSAGSTFDVEITNGNANGFDKVNVTGAVSIATGGAGVTLNLTTLRVLDLQDGQQLAIIDNAGNDAVQGMFKDLPEGTILSANFLGSGLTAKISYVGGDGNDVAIELSSQSSFPWHNAAKPLDVNGGQNNAPDDHIVAGDALAVINYLNAFGSGAVPGNAVSGLPFGFIDTDGDSFVTASDALDVINFLNAGLGGEGEGVASAEFGLRTAERQAGIDAAIANEVLISLLALDVAEAEERAEITEFLAGRGRVFGFTSGWIDTRESAGGPSRVVSLFQMSPLGQMQARETYPAAWPLLHFDDGDVDRPTGSSGRDWFFANLDNGVLEEFTDLGNDKDKGRM